MNNWFKALFLMVFVFALIGLASGQANSDKIDGKLQKELNEGNELIYLIVHINGVVGNTEKGELQSLGARIRHEYKIINATAISIEKVQVEKIAKLEFVERLELDSETKASLPQSTAQIGVQRVWLGYNAFGENVKIAVLDTGIDNEHRDLKNVILEKDFINEGTDDLNGHGTHVAGIIAGSGELSGGINRGVAPKAELIDVKVLDKNGNGRILNQLRTGNEGKYTGWH